MGNPRIFFQKRAARATKKPENRAFLLMDEWAAGSGLRSAAESMKQILSKNSDNPMAFACFSHGAAG